MATSDGAEVTPSWCQGDTQGLEGWMPSWLKKEVLWSDCASFFGLYTATTQSHYTAWLVRLPIVACNRY